MKILSILTVAVFLWGGAVCAAQEPNWKTGAAFRDQLDAGFSVSFDGLSLRDVVKRIAGTHQVSILIDRRIDPDQTVRVAFSNLSLRDGIGQVAQAADCGVSIVDNVIYLGPHRSADRLRTLIELRTEEFRERLGQLDGARKRELTTPLQVTWTDLTEPRELVDAVCGQRSLRPANPEAIEYDLWAAGALPGVSIAEALSLLLIPFDLTFAWDDAAESVTAVPIPDEVFIEKSYPLRRGDAELDAWREFAPDAVFERDGRRVSVRGTVEDHEIIAELRAGRTPRRPAAGDGPAAPLARRRFTLKLAGVPASAVLAKLEESGVKFEYDADQLQAAGVDLNAHVKIDVTAVKAEEFFDALLGPLGVDCEIDGLTVRLAPK